MVIQVKPICSTESLDLEPEWKRHISLTLLTPILEVGKLRSPPGEVQGLASAILKASNRPGLMETLSAPSCLLPETMAYNSSFRGSGPSSCEDTWEMGTHLKCQQVACFPRARGVPAFIRKVGSAHRAASRRQAQRLQSLAQLTHPREQLK